MGLSDALVKAHEQAKKKQAELKERARQKQKEVNPNAERIKRNS